MRYKVPVKHVAPALRANRLKVLFVSAEIFPLAKTGGLGDVCGTLPLAVSEDGEIDIVLMLPGYDCVFAQSDEWTEIARLDDLPGGPARLLLGTLPDSDLRVVVLDQPQSFRRAGGLYVDDAGQEWSDNAQRFAALSHAAVRLATGLILPYWRADIVHCNDWHTALVPVLLADQAGRRPRTILTLHNLAFQGLFPRDAIKAIGLPASSFTVDGVEYFGKISFLKGGLNFADKLTTVSPSYAHEIRTAEFGMGLEGVLERRHTDLSGIMNGIDGDVWDPAQDLLLPARFSADDLSGKALCKAALQRDWGLTVDPTAPLLIFLARIEAQKMADTLLEILPELMQTPDIQIAIAGQGSTVLENGFRAWPERAPNRVSVRIGYDEKWAHQLLGGADMLIHGARFEPCGLTPMYAMRYGTVPVVRAVGGMRDSVTPVNEMTLAAGTATGFQFASASSTDLLEAINRALALLGQETSWRRVQYAGMRKDFSWSRPAAQYRRLYSELAAA